MEARVGSEAYLEASRDTIFRNTFADIDRMLKSWARAAAPASNSNATMSAISTISRISSIAGCVKPPLFIQFMLGMLGGIGADPENLLHMKRIADQLFGDSYRLVGARRRPPPDAR